MKDSVLELKWRAEQAEARLRAAVARARAADVALVPGTAATTITITPRHDPAASFPFTRIAAPGALLGGYATPAADDEAPEPADAEPADAEPAEAAVAAFKKMRARAAAPPALPYSSTALAIRMYRNFAVQQQREEFFTFFSGEFDNFAQISAQRARGVFPGDGGGHEHIHCSLTRLPADMIFARYYFNGNPDIVFRSRLYKVLASDVSERGIIEMRIYRFYEETERRLKASGYDIGAISWDDGDVYDWLEGAEVFWERNEVPSGEKDTAVTKLGIEKGPRFVGSMKNGGCELYSREIKGRIRVLDDLLLTGQDLWVADRGFGEDGEFVYGNRRGEPYKMKRIDESALGEKVDPAFWTLSGSTPPPEGYVA